MTNNLRFLYILVKTIGFLDANVKVNIYKSDQEWINLIYPLHFADHILLLKMPYAICTMCCIQVEKMGDVRQSLGNCSSQMIAPPMKTE